MVTLKLGRCRPDSGGEGKHQDLRCIEQKEAPAPRLVHYQGHNPVVSTAAFGVDQSQRSGFRSLGQSWPSTMASKDAAIEIQASSIQRA